MSNQFVRVAFGSGSGGGSNSVKSAVSIPAALPLTGNTVDDLRYVISEETFYRWTGSEWVPQTANAKKYLDQFVIADWVLNGSEYWIEYDEATHLKGTNPMVQVLELSAALYESVILTVEITNAGVVRLKVPQSPDLRFDGKTIIA